jgi:hypothetical protein
MYTIWLKITSKLTLLERWYLHRLLNMLDSIAAYIQQSPQMRLVHVLIS